MWAKYWCMAACGCDGEAADTPVAGHGTCDCAGLHNAPRLLPAALHQPICSPAAARGGHQWLERWQKLPGLQNILTTYQQSKETILNK